MIYCKCAYENLHMTYENLHIRFTAILEYTALLSPYVFLPLILRTLSL